MSRTNKDLKSHKNRIGKYGLSSPSRKMKPLALDASIISGKKTDVLVFTDNDLSQDGFNNNEHWHNAKAVKALRKQLRVERKSEKHSARNKMKQELKNQINETIR